MKNKFIIVSNQTYNNNIIHVATTKFVTTIVGIITAIIYLLYELLWLAIKD